ncbi:S-layer homology domain-containing protein [bacterium LRH843]|nr:S-layer homology domain-containing protein [bacterium LRH843]
MTFYKRIPFAVLSTTFASLLLASAVSAEGPVEVEPISSEIIEEVVGEIPVEEIDEESDHVTEQDEENIVEEEVVSEEEQEVPEVEKEIVPSFLDVPTSHFAFGAIEYLYSNQLIKGKGDGRFAPNEPITRAEAASMISNVLQIEASSSYVLKGKDVSKTNWAYEPIRALEERGILTGNNGLIRPHDAISRAEVSSILQRSFRYAKPVRFISFSDLNRSHWAYESVNVLAANGITSQAGGTYRPNDSTSRAEFAAFLARSLDDKFK